MTPAPVMAPEVEDRSDHVPILTHKLGPTWREVTAIATFITLVAGCIWWAVTPRFVSASDFQDFKEARAREAEAKARDEGHLAEKVDGLTQQVSGMRADISRLVDSMNRRGR